MHLGYSVSGCFCFWKSTLGSPLTGMSHLCLLAAQFAICCGGTALYISASITAVAWYYWYHTQQARGLSRGYTELACVAMTVVLATAGFMLADLAYRMWPMLSLTGLGQAVSSISSILPDLVERFPARQSCVFHGLCWPAVHCRTPAADMRPAGCRASLQQQPVPAGHLWQLHCGSGRAYVSGQAPGSSSWGST